MKYFVMADIHGFYNEMQDALTKAGFDPSNSEHIFVSLGDALDRGSQPREVLEFMLNLDPSRRILIRGNHEDLMEEAIVRHGFLAHDISNGTRNSARALTGLIDDTDVLLEMRVLPLYNNYIRECADWAETDHYVFVHGWIPCFTHKKMSMYRDQVEYIPMEDDWRIASRHLWGSARWYNGMDAWGWGVREPNKTICCGHWHSDWGHQHIHHEKKENFTPFVDEGIIALDACTAYSGFCNCVVLEDGAFSIEGSH